MYRFAVDDAVGAYKASAETALAARAIEAADFTSLFKSLEALESASRVQRIKTTLGADGGGVSVSTVQALTLMDLAEVGP